MSLRLPMVVRNEGGGEWDEYGVPYSPNRLELKIKST